LGNDSLRSLQLTKDCDENENDNGGVWREGSRTRPWFWVIISPGNLKTHTHTHTHTHNKPKAHTHARRRIAKIQLVLFICFDVQILSTSSLFLPMFWDGETQPLSQEGIFRREKSHSRMLSLLYRYSLSTSSSRDQILDFKTLSNYLMISRLTGTPSTI
jgi:hypothetical protein